MYFSEADTLAPPTTQQYSAQCYQCTLIPQQTSSVTDTASVLFPCTKNISKAIKNESFTIFFAVCGIVLKCFGIKTQGTKFLFYFQRKQMEAEQHIL